MWRRTMTLVLATVMFGTGTIKAEAGYLGVEIEDALHGVRVTRVIAGSPAEAFGLRPGYIISGLGAEAVGSTADFATRIRLLEPGQWSTLQVISGGTVATDMITTQDRVAAERGVPFEPLKRGVLSIGMEDHVREVAGVRVMVVQRGGAGERGGLVMGDVVVAVNGRRTADTESFLAEIARRAGQPTPITLIRRERSRTLVVVPDAMDSRAVFASIPEATTDVAEAHWCERGNIQTAVCVAVALGGVLMLGSILDDEKDSESESAKAKREQERQHRDRRAVQEYERAIDTNVIRRWSLPN